MPDAAKLKQYRQEIRNGIRDLTENLEGRSAPMEALLLDMQMEFAVSLGYLVVVKNELVRVRALLEERKLDEVADEVNERLQLRIDMAKVEMLERATGYFDADEEEGPEDVS